MRAIEFKKQFIKQSIEERKRILSEMEKDIEKSKQERTEPQHLMFLDLIKWSKEHLNETKILR